MHKKHDQYQYKRLFPGHVFEFFVAIGNFQRDPNAYSEITHAWNAIPIDELTKIKQGRLQSMNPRQEPTRFIDDYGVYECLGSGAFGSVYRVSQRGSTNMYALKEVRSISQSVSLSSSAKLLLDLDRQSFVGPRWESQSWANDQRSEHHSRRTSTSEHSELLSDIYWKYRRWTIGFSFMFICV